MNSDPNHLGSVCEKVQCPVAKYGTDTLTDILLYIIKNTL